MPWKLKLQKFVAVSTIEVEYVDVVKAKKKMLGMKWFLQQLGLKQKEYVVFYDGQSIVDLSKNFMYHSCKKYIDMKCHWLLSIIEEKLMVLNKIHINKNIVHVD